MHYSYVNAREYFLGIYPCISWALDETLQGVGAGEGNRTLVVSLGSFCSAIELHPQQGDFISHRPLPASARQDRSLVFCCGTMTSVTITGELATGLGGFTGYYYTGDFDDTYQEINLSAGYKFITFDVAIGDYENFGGPTNRYAYSALTLQHNGFYGKYGRFDDEFDGAYWEAGYSTSLADLLDISFYALYADENLIGEEEHALVFTIGKTFDLN